MLAAAPPPLGLEGAHVEATAVAASATLAATLEVGGSVTAVVAADNAGADGDGNNNGRNMVAMSDVGAPANNTIAA